ncbi:MAG TPA: ABC transporter permease, partial [Candidatus Manganitrophaceae bacterium]|nr:ABC transporter permease [Candidatus Manganitrophaceae bacterium]
MRAIEIFTNALRNLSSNKLRSGLTMLGVIIGVSAVIAMSSIVEGGKKLTVEMIEKMGTNLLSIRPKKLNEEELRAFSGRSKGLRYGDAETVKSSVPHAREVTPVVNVSTQLKYGDRDYSGMVEGVLEGYQSIRNYDLDRGRFLSQEDAARFEKVAVLGKDVTRELFSAADPLGADVKIGDQRFTVIGVLKEKGSLHGINYDETVLIPATTAIKFFKGSDELGSFIVKVDDRRNMKRTDEIIKSILLRRHNGVEDFVIR